MRKIIEDNPILSVVVAMGIMFGATQTIGGGFKYFDRLICTESEAEEIYKQQSEPVQRDFLDFQIFMLESQVRTLKEKERAGKGEAWEPDLIDDLEGELDRLKSKKYGGQ
jgi:hypothetical protein